MSATSHKIPQISSADEAASQAIIDQMLVQEKRCSTLKPVVLDLTVREPTVGASRGHTLADKLALFELVRQAGFRDILLGTFNVSLPDAQQVDDLFMETLIKQGADLTGGFGFAGTGEFNAQGEFQPDGSMKKLVQYGIPNAIVDLDIASWNMSCSREAFLGKLLASIDWMRTNMRGDEGKPPRIYINYQDGTDAFFEDWRWIVQLTRALAEHKAVSAITFEDGKGTVFPFQVGAMTALIRKHLRPDQLLLVHMHSGIGMENACLLEAILQGADGIWSGFTREAATCGHAPSSEFIANLARIGNDSVAASYPLERFASLVNQMTEINTLAPTPDDFPIFGANAYRTMLTFFMQDDGRKMDLPPARIGVRTGWRVAPVASDLKVIRGRLREFDAHLSDEVLRDEVMAKMRVLMREDMRAGLRLEYDRAEILLELHRRALLRLAATVGPSFSTAGATPWNDQAQSAAQGPLSRIQIVAGDVVDNIQSFYGNHQAPLRGSRNPNPPAQISIDVDNPIVEITGSIFSSDGKFLSQLIFKTLKGQTFGPYGRLNGEPFALKAPAGMCISSLFGAVAQTTGNTPRFYPTGLGATLAALSSKTKTAS